jgi:cytochrome c-type biogenesis protein CcmH/NrfG
MHILREVKRKLPNEAGIYLLLARAHEMLGDAGEAQRAYEKFLKLAPSEHPDIPKAERFIGSYKE